MRWAALANCPRMLQPQIMQASHLSSSDHTSDCSSDRPMPTHHHPTGPPPAASPHKPAAGSGSPGPRQPPPGGRQRRGSRQSQLPPSSGTTRSAGRGHKGRRAVAVACSTRPTAGQASYMLWGTQQLSSLHTVPLHLPNHSTEALPRSPHLRLPNAEPAARLRRQQVAAAGRPAQEAGRLGASLGGRVHQIW